MTILPRSTRHAAILGLAAAATLGVGASSAGAAVTKQLTFDCKYPLVGTNPLTVDITADIPATAPVNTPTPGYAINVTASAGGQTGDAIDSLDARFVSGESTAFSTVTSPSGAKQQVEVPITVNEWARPPISQPVPNPLVLTAQGTTPSLTLAETGDTTIDVDRISLNLTALDRNRAPIEVLPLDTDIDENPVTDSDGDPTTFDVYCKLAPADQDRRLTTVNVTP